MMALLKDRPRQCPAKLGKIKRLYGGTRDERWFERSKSHASVLPADGAMVILWD